MKSIFLASVAFCVLLVSTKNANCKPLDSIEKKSIVSSIDSDNVTAEVTSNGLGYLVNSEKRFRIKRQVVGNVGCPFNMRRFLICIPKRTLRFEKRRNRKHGPRKHTKHRNNL